MPLFESGAILHYLAEKTGQLLPNADPARRWQTIQWLHFQMGGIGPMFGQVGFFHKFAGKDIADKRPLERYVAEAKRLLGVIEDRLAGAAMDHGRRLHHRRHLDAGLGAQSDRLL
jgi:GST-like protein